MENIALVTIKFPTVKAIEAQSSDEGEMASPATKQPRPAQRCRPANKPNGMANSKPETSTIQPTVGVKFISAGLAACWADLITFPLDTAKVRLQIQGEGAVVSAVRGLAVTMEAAPKYKGMLGTMTTISREEGLRALYNGLVPGLQRQMAFASIRIGLYDSVKQSYIKLFQAEGSVGGNNVPIGLRILAGITTGGLAVSCAQPTDVVKVRMQAAGKGPKRYTGCMQAYRMIAVKEGVRGLWKGTLPNITRNAIVNCGELVSYDLIKEAILSRGLLSDTMPCHFISAFGAGFCATVVASPVDVVKTRFMNSAPGQYTGATQVALKMYREGGSAAFYKGFLPSFMRLGSWNIVMFVSYEQLKRFFTDMKHQQTLTSSTLPEVSLQNKKYM